MSESLNSIIRVRDKVRVVNNSISIEVEQTFKRKKSLQEVQQIAYEIEDKLGKESPSRFPKYCGYAWKLPEATIRNNLEAALSPKVRSPRAMFTFLCESNMPK